jgi:purine-binding chemotaxis protein CheW
VLVILQRTVGGLVQRRRVISWRGAMTERDGEHGPRRAHDGVASLVCRVATRICALPLDAVIETMRPLPVEPIAGAPAFIAGLAIIRGAPVPVVDAARLLGAGGGRPGRFVTLRVAPRTVALAVDAVLGVRALPADRLSALPPLAGAVAAEVVAAVGMLDARLLVVLEAARLVPDAVFALVERAAS